MAIRIITDSTSDIDIKKQEELGIDILPLTVSFGEEHYIDGVTITNEEFFTKLRNCEKLPVTTQLNPDKFVELFEKYKKAGDTVIAILISSKLSGTFQSAQIAKDMCEADNVYLIDSMAVTIALSALVYEAIKLRDNGVDAKEIYETILEATKSLKFYAMVDTLKYLKMGGRLSASAAVVGSMLNIKPIITTRNGEIVVASKTRGKKAAFEFMASKVTEVQPDINRSFVYGSSDNAQLRQELISFFGEKFEDVEYKEVNIGSVVGSHGGPNCVGFAYFPKK